VTSLSPESYTMLRAPTEREKNRTEIGSARRPHLPRRDPKIMDITKDELKAHLMATNEEFRRLATEHAEYKKQVEALESLPHPSDQEQFEEHRLKKLKLHLKDQMMEIMNRHRALHA
jgi:uncharacterized protein YdcH (DUF465 family)